MLWRLQSASISEYLWPNATESHSFSDQVFILSLSSYLTELHQEEWFKSFSLRSPGDGTPAYNFGIQARNDQLKKKYILLKKLGREVFCFHPNLYVQLQALFHWHNTRP